MESATEDSRGASEPGQDGAAARAVRLDDAGSVAGGYGLFELVPAGEKLRVLTLRVNSAEKAVEAEEEDAAIQEVLCEHTGLIKFRTRGSVSLDQARKLVADFLPHCVHFIGHGAIGGLQLHLSDAVADGALPLAEALAAPGSVLLAVFNCSNSAHVARAVCEHPNGVAVAIGTSHEVPDAVAMSFAAALWAALMPSGGEDTLTAQGVGDAFLHARGTLSLDLRGLYCLFEDQPEAGPDPEAVPDTPTPDEVDSSADKLPVATAPNAPSPNTQPTPTAPTPTAALNDQQGSSRSPWLILAALAPLLLLLLSAGLAFRSPTFAGSDHHDLQGATTLGFSMAFSDDGLLAAGFSKTVSVWNASTGARLWTVEGHTKRVLAVAFADDGSGRLVASGSRDCRVRVWSASGGAHLWTLEGHSAAIHAVAFAGDGSGLLASGGGDKTVRVWSLSTGECLRTLSLGGGWVWIRSLAFAGDGSALLAVGLLDGTVWLWNAGTGQHLRTLESGGGGVRSVAFAKDGSGLLASGSGSVVRVWDFRTGEQLHALYGHGADVCALAFANDDTGRLASGSVSSIVRVWNARSGAHLQTLEGHASTVLSVVFVNGTGELMSASRDKKVRVWKPQRSVFEVVYRGIDWLLW